MLIFFFNSKEEKCYTVPHPENAFMLPDFPQISPRKPGILNRCAAFSRNVTKKTTNKKKKNLRN